VAIGVNARHWCECSLQDMEGCSHVSCELKAKASKQSPAGIGSRRVVVSADKRRAVAAGGADAGVDALGRAGAAAEGVVVAEVAAAAVIAELTS
jgi:hypothetical protein